MATVDMNREFREVWTCTFRICERTDKRDRHTDRQTDRHTERQTDTLIAIVRTHTSGKVIRMF